MDEEDCQCWACEVGGYGSVKFVSERGGFKGNVVLLLLSYPFCLAVSHINI